MPITHIRIAIATYSHSQRCHHQADKPGGLAGLGWVSLLGAPGAILSPKNTWAIFGRMPKLNLLIFTKSTQPTFRGPAPDPTATFLDRRAPYYRVNHTL